MRPSTRNQNPPDPGLVTKVCETLHRKYGSPRLGNHADPLDELIYIIISTRTSHRVFRPVFAEIKRTFPDWNEIGPRQRARLVEILKPAGLARLKTKQIIQILCILRKAFGNATLDPLRKMTARATEDFLVELPGVGKKIAKCVMMYSLGHEVLPVDSHVHRLASKIGLSIKRRPDTSQELIEAAIPAKLRYGFHVNAIAHGRAVCVGQRPRCNDCCISFACVDRTANA
jgi:endonuclease III